MHDPSSDQEDRLPDHDCTYRRGTAFRGPRASMPGKSRAQASFCARMAYAVRGWIVAHHKGVEKLERVEAPCRDKLGDEADFPRPQRVGHVLRAHGHHRNGTGRSDNVKCRKLGMQGLQCVRRVAIEVVGVAVQWIHKRSLAEIGGPEVLLVRGYGRGRCMAATSTTAQAGSRRETLDCRVAAGVW